MLLLLFHHLCFHRHSGMVPHTGVVVVEVEEDKNTDDDGNKDIDNDWILHHLGVDINNVDQEDDDDNCCLGNRADEDVFDVEEVTGCDGGGVI